MSTPKRAVRGSRNAQSKLTEEIVYTMRAKYAEGVSIADLADQYDVEVSTARKAIMRQTWRHVP